VDISTNMSQTQKNIDESLAKIEVRLSELEKRLDKTRIDKFFELATRFALPLIIAIGSVALSLHDRVNYLEATGFTKYDYQRDMSDVKMQIEKMKGTDPFVRDSFTKLDTKLDALRDNLDNVKERVIKLEGAK
jgi:predicted nuclease with TOPRIM domain